MDCSKCGRTMHLCKDCGKIYCSHCEYTLIERSEKELTCPECGSRDTTMANSSTETKLRIGRAHL